MTRIRFAASAIAMAGVLATAAYAAGEGTHAGPQNAPAEQHGMMSMMGRMNPAQMKQMMEDCGKMMGATAPSNAPSAPQQPRS